MPPISRPSRRTPPRFARWRLALALAACLGAMLACGDALLDTAAHPLNAYDVVVAFSAVGPDGTVDVQFDLTYQGQTHKLSSGETITCDGARLTTFPGSTTLSAAIPQRAPGGTYRCVFTAGDHSATLTIPALVPPRLTAPASGATLARLSGFTVAYAPGSAVAEVDVLAHLPGPQNHFFSARRVAPQTFAVDPHDALSDSPTGPGALDITTFVRAPLRDTGGLRSLTASYATVTTVPVEWS